MAAQSLQTAGLRVAVVDKGRGVGGRMAHRRMTLPNGQIARFDHGAQYFTAKSPAFRAFTNRWLEAGIIREWAQGFADSDGAMHVNGEPRYVCPNGMTAIAKHLAQNLEVRTQVRVTRVRFQENYMVETEGGEKLEADALVMTPPVPQSLALLQAGDVRLDKSVVSALEKIEYAPCIAVLCALASPSQIPALGGLWPVGGEPISWIADNRQKGVSDVPTVTIHASAAFSRAHYDEDGDVVARILVDHAQAWLGARVDQFSVHRWRYSIPTVLHDQPVLVSHNPAPIVFAGDAFAGPRVEGAALSGLAAGKKIN